MLLAAVFSLLATPALAQEVSRAWCLYSEFPSVFDGGIPSHVYGLWFLYVRGWARSL